MVRNYYIIRRIILVIYYRIISGNWPVNNVDLGGIYSDNHLKSPKYKKHTLRSVFTGYHSSKAAEAALIEQELDIIKNHLDDTISVGAEPENYLQENARHQRLIGNLTSST